MPSDFTLKSMNNIHRVILKLSGGRKSGEPRMVVVASRGGDDEHPAWFVNLRANPIVEIETQGSQKEKCRARIASAGEREIPLVLLEPLS